EKKKLLELMDTLAESVRDRLLALSLAWGQRDLFGARFEEIVAPLRNDIANANVADEKRIAAAKRLAGMDSSVETTDFILEQITTLTPPELARGLIASLAEGGGDLVARELIGKWKRFT